MTTSNLSLSNLRESVKSLADSFNYKVVLMVLDNLDKAIEEGWERPKPGCSYSNYLGYYVNYKTILHHLMSANERSDMREGALFFDQRRHELMTNMNRAHSLMYTSVCFNCPTCLRRKKPWPTVVYQK